MSTVSLPLAVATLVAFAALAQVALADMEVNVEGNFDELSQEQLRDITKLQGAFQEIQKTVGQDKNNFDPEASMETARAMQKRDWAFGLLNGRLKEALRLFTSLPAVASEKEYCSYKGYEILAKNFILNPQSGHITYTTSILYHYAREHAVQCWPRYVKNFLWESNAVSILPMLKQLNKYFEGLELDDFTPETLDSIPSESEELAQIPLVEANLNTFDIRASGLVKILKNMDFGMGQQVAGSSQASFVQTIIEGNLLKPCGVLVEQMRDIFAPAKIDLFMYRAGKQQVTQPDLNGKFVKAWSSYRVCLYFDRADRRQMVSRFVKALEIGASE